MNCSAKWTVGITLASPLLSSFLLICVYQKTVVKFKAHANSPESITEKHNNKHLDKINITYNTKVSASPCSPWRKKNIKQIKTISSGNKVEVFMKSYVELCNQYDYIYYPKENNSLCLCIPTTIGNFVDII